MNTQAPIIHFVIILDLSWSLTGEHIRMLEMCSVLHDQRHGLSIHPVHPSISICLARQCVCLVHQSFGLQSSHINNPLSHTS